MLFGALDPSGCTAVQGRRRVEQRPLGVGAQDAAGATILGLSMFGTLFLARPGRFLTLSAVTRDASAPAPAVSSVRWGATPPRGRLRRRAVSVSYVRGGVHQRGAGHRLIGLVALARVGSGLRLFAWRRWWCEPRPARSVFLFGDANGIAC